MTLTYALTLLDVIELTPNTRHYVFTRPDGYEFETGQATDLALDQDGWRDEKRPFTFTNAPDADILSFTIKSYPDHNGVTDRLWSLTPGDRVLVGDPWGAIEDKGPGVFIAGGTGITPFIGILKARARKGALENCTLIYANEAAENIILKPCWDSMDDLAVHHVLSEGSDEYHSGRIDETLLKETVQDWGQNFYVCGPPPMEESVVEILRENGVGDDQIIRED